MILPKSEFSIGDVQEVGPDGPSQEPETERLTVTLHASRGNMGDFPAATHQGMPLFNVGEFGRMQSGVNKQVVLTMKEFNAVMANGNKTQRNETAVSVLSPKETLPDGAPLSHRTRLRTMHDVPAFVAFTGFSEMENSSYIKLNDIRQTVRIPEDITGKQFVQRLWENEKTGADLWIIFYYKQAAEAANTISGDIHMVGDGLYKKGVYTPSPALESFGGGAKAKDDYVIQAITYCDPAIPDPRDNTTREVLEKIYPGHVRRDLSAARRIELSGMWAQKVGRVVISARSGATQQKALGVSSSGDAYYEQRMRSLEGTARGSALATHALSAEAVYMEIVPEPCTVAEYYVCPLFDD